MFSHGHIQQSSSYWAFLHEALVAASPFSLTELSSASPFDSLIVIHQSPASALKCSPRSPSSALCSPCCLSPPLDILSTQLLEPLGWWHSTLYPQAWSLSRVSEVWVPASSLPWGTPPGPQTHYGKNKSPFNSFSHSNLPLICMFLVLFNDIPVTGQPKPKIWKSCKTSLLLLCRFSRVQLCATPSVKYQIILI